METIKYDKKALSLVAKAMTLKDESCKSGKWKVQARSGRGGPGRARADGACGDVAVPILRAQYGWDAVARGVTVEILNPDSAYQLYGRKAHFAGALLRPMPRSSVA